MSAFSWKNGIPLISISCLISWKGTGCIFCNTCCIAWPNFHISFQGFASLISMFHSQKDTMTDYFHLSIHSWSYRQIYIPLSALANEIKMQGKSIRRECYRKSITLIKLTGLAEIRQFRVFILLLFSLATLNLFVAKLGQTSKWMKWCKFYGILSS